MLQLSLHSEHERIGARFAPEGEWELPERYQDPLLEYRAVREHVGLADLSYQGAFMISGNDRISFLQNLISNNLNDLPEGKGIYSTLLTAKGRVIADFYLYPMPESLLMELEGSNAEKTRQHLIRYRLRAQVKIEPPSWGRILLAGPNATAVLGRLSSEGWAPMEEKAIVHRVIDGLSIVCIKRSMTGETDYHLYVPQAEMEKFWGRLLSIGSDFGILPVGQTALEMLRIEAGKPRYGIDIDEHIIPIEAGLGPEAISYTKGCYPGQEVMARIQTYGHVNKNLFGLVLEGEALPARGDKVFQGEQELGWVTSATRSPLLGKGIAMGYLRPQIALAGTAVEIEINQTRTPARTTTLPFYTRKEPVSS
jgi:glycine cleavage system T protein